MNNNLSFQQIQKTSNLDANLISRQNKLNLMDDFMRVKYENPKMKQFEIANQLSLSSGTLQRYRNYINMLSPYRINQNTTNKRTKNASKANFVNSSHSELDIKRPQMTSSDLNTISNNKPIRYKKSKLKGGANIEINEHCLDEILHNKNS